MPRMPELVDPTLAACDKAIEDFHGAIPQRAYLGMSGIGFPCSRKQWYGFRLSSAPGFTADTIKKFEDGHRTEDLMAERLKAVPGIELQTVDPATGEQFACVDHGGHFRGHLDGIISGLLQAPVTPHVWENKATDDKRLAALQKAKSEHGEKHALEAWDATYYGQAQVYMYYRKLRRHYLTCCSPGGRSAVSVRTDYDAEKAEALSRKALDIITSNEPPPKIGGPDFYLCKWCEHHALCHGKAFAQVNCRTCAHSTPVLSGNAAWQCDRFPDDPIPLDVQRTGCRFHVYRPDLVPAELVDASESENSATYKKEDGVTFRNGGDGYASADLYHGGLAAVAAGPFSGD